MERCDIFVILLENLLFSKVVPLLKGAESKNTLDLSFESYLSKTDIDSSWLTNYGKRQ